MESQETTNEKYRDPGKTLSGFCLAEYQKQCIDLTAVYWISNAESDFIIDFQPRTIKIKN